MRKNDIVYRILVDGDTIVITAEMIESTEPQIMQEYLRMLWRQEHRERREYRCRNSQGVRCNNVCSECPQGCSGKPVSLDALTEAGATFADSRSVEAEVERNLIYEELYAALDTLNDLDRQIIELIFFCDYTERDVAKRVKMSQKGVNRRKVKALNFLRKQLETPGNPGKMVA